MPSSQFTDMMEDTLAQETQEVERLRAMARRALLEGSRLTTPVEDEVLVDSVPTTSPEEPSMSERLEAARRAMEGQRASVAPSPWDNMRTSRSTQARRPDLGRAYGIPSEYHTGVDPIVQEYQELRQSYNERLSLGETITSEERSALIEAYCNVIDGGFNA